MDINKSINEIKMLEEKRESAHMEYVDILGKLRVQINNSEEKDITISKDVFYYLLNHLNIV